MLATLNLSCVFCLSVLFFWCLESFFVYGTLAWWQISYRKKPLFLSQKEKQKYVMLILRACLATKLYSSGCAAHALEASIILQCTWVGAKWSVRVNVDGCGFRNASLEDIELLFD